MASPWRTDYVLVETRISFGNLSDAALVAMRLTARLIAA
jgi:hypothetical protein